MLTIAVEVAERMLTPQRVYEVMGDTVWDPGELASGLPGVAILHATLAQVTGHDRYVDAAHEHLLAAYEHAVRDPAPGAWYGPGAVMVAMLVAAPTCPGRYDSALARGVAWMSESVALVADQVEEALRTGRMYWQLYDALTGLAGTARVLLAANRAGVPGAEPALSRALAALIAVCRAGGEVPGWLVREGDLPPNTVMPSSDVAPTGIAHGIAGPLAVLSAARSAGHDQAGHAEAIHTAAYWLTGWYNPDGWWPPFVPLAWMFSPTSRDGVPIGPRWAWCYGIPGIARALQLASAAMDDPTLIVVAERAWTAAADAQWPLQGPTVCHGYAGMLAAANRAVDNGLAAAEPAARRAGEAIVEQFDPSAPLGFRHRDPEGRPLDVPGLLTGAAGVALSLLTADIETPKPSITWDMPLLIT